MKAEEETRFLNVDLDGRDMSAVPCPECMQVGFTWSIDAEQPNLTRWRCALCRYTAEEDESEQRRCPSCGDEGAIRLRDPSGSYLFCTRCRLRSTSWHS